MSASFVVCSSRKRQEQLERDAQSAPTNGMCLWFLCTGVSEDVFKDLKFDTETIMFEWELMKGTADLVFFPLNNQKLSFNLS